MLAAFDTGESLSGLWNSMIQSLILPITEAEVNTYFQLSLSSLLYLQISAESSVALLSIRVEYIVGSLAYS